MSQNDIIPNIFFTDKNKISEFFFFFLNLLFIILLGNEINSVVGMDATYKFCKEDLILLAFIAVNKFFLTEVIAICLMNKDKKDNYNFALNSFEKVFQKRPKIIYIDRHLGQESALKESWDNVTRLYCILHIYHNIQKNIGIF